MIRIIHGSMSYMNLFGVYVYIYNICRHGSQKVGVEVRLHGQTSHHRRQCSRQNQYPPPLCQRRVQNQPHLHHRSRLQSQSHTHLITQHQNANMGYCWPRTLQNNYLNILQGCGSCHLRLLSHRSQDLRKHRQLAQTSQRHPTIKSV